MASINAKMERVLASRAGRASLSLALTVLFVLLALQICTPTFYENDDSNIAFALAGYFSGEPYPAHPFINCLLGGFTSFLCRVLPTVPWWAVLQICTVGLSAFLTGCALFSICARRHVHVLVTLMLFGIVIPALYFYPLVLITFTLTSACAGAAGVALLLACFPGEETVKEMRVRVLLSLFSLILCFLFRNSTGISMLCFYLGALFILLCRALILKAGRIWVRRAALLTVAVLLLSGTLAAVNAWGLSAYNADGFVSFEQARGKYLDYPVDTYSDNPALYESVSWDRPLYAMVRQWYFMDERITAESLNALIDGSAQTSLSPSEALKTWTRFVSIRPMIAYEALPAGSFFVLGLYLCLKDGQKWRELLFLLCMLAGAMALIAYLLLSGRMVERAFQVVAMPTVSACAMLVAGMCTPVSGKKPRAALSLILSLFLLLPGLFGAYRQVRTVISYGDSAPALLEKSRALIGYALSHEDTVFIRDTHVANNVDALTTYPDQKPVNLLDWGGTGTLTGARAKQLDLLGIKSYTADIFLSENVRFVTETDSRDCKAFSAYIVSRFPTARLEMTDTVCPGVDVYRVLIGKNGGERP